MEEIEVPTEHLHEAIQEKAEEEKEKWVLWVALSTAVMAVLAAVAGLLAGHHANEALIERVRASDQWSFYQAKNLKEEIAVNTDQLLSAITAGKPVTGGDLRAAATSDGKPVIKDHDKDIARYEKEKQEIKKTAEEAEKASELHLNKHVPLASAVTSFQIAIAVSAIAILTKRKRLWYGSLILTGVGIVFFLMGFF